MNYTIERAINENPYLFIGAGELYIKENSTLRWVGKPIYIIRGKAGEWLEAYKTKKGAVDCVNRLNLLAQNKACQPV